MLPCLPTALLVTAKIPGRKRPPIHPHEHQLSGQRVDHLELSKEACSSLQLGPDKSSKELYNPKKQRHWPRLPSRKLAEDRLKLNLILLDVWSFWTGHHYVVCTSWSLCTSLKLSTEHRLLRHIIVLVRQVITCERRQRLFKGLH